MSNRSLPVIVAVVVSLLVLSACSAAVPTVTAEGTRDILLCVFVLLGVVLFCLAQGMTIPMPWGVLSPPRGRVRRRNQGLLGGALILLGAIGLFIPLPEKQPLSATAVAPPQDLGTTDKEKLSPSPRPSLPSIGSMIRVMDLDGSSQQVSSDVYLIDELENSTYLGKTAEDGNFMILPKHECVEGRMIQVRPNRKYGPGTRDCPIDDNMRINVVQLAYLENLRTAAAALEDRGMYHVAALVYNELAARSSGSEADEFAVKTYKMVAMSKAMQFEETESALDAEDRIGPSLFNAIRAFQQRNGLPASGILDYATLARLAHDPIAPYIIRRLVLPALLPERIADSPFPCCTAQKLLSERLQATCPESRSRGRS